MLSRRHYTHVPKTSRKEKAAAASSSSEQVGEPSNPSDVAEGSNADGASASTEAAGALDTNQDPGTNKKGKGKEVDSTDRLKQQAILIVDLKPSTPMAAFAPLNSRQTSSYLFRVLTTHPVSGEQALRIIEPRLGLIKLCLSMVKDHGVSAYRVDGKNRKSLLAQPTTEYAITLSGQLPKLEDRDEAEWAQKKERSITSMCHARRHKQAKLDDPEASSDEDPLETGAVGRCPYLLSMLRDEYHIPLTVATANAKVSFDPYVVTVYHCPEEAKVDEVIELANKTYQYLSSMINGTSAFYPLTHSITSTDTTSLRASNISWLQAHRNEVHASGTLYDNIQAVADNFSSARGLA